MAYITVRVTDKDGNLCPDDNRLVNFRVTGAGKYRASANGDPGCLDLFHLPQMHAFSGQLTAIVQAGELQGEIKFEATANGVTGAELSIRSEK